MAEGPIRTYIESDFAASSDPCDIIMKGGVTSGVVYPYAVLELATRHRFRSIGGTSAGAIAAALTAAAEFARRNGDPAGFIRLQQRCEQLPELLRGLFQEDADLKPAVTAAEELASTRGKPPARWFALPALLGAALLGLALWFLFRGLGGGQAVQVAAALTGVIVGGAVSGLLALWRKFRLFAGAVRSLPERSFGLCSGLTQPRVGHVALTDWLHEAIQQVAFGADWEVKPPLTFGDLEATAEPIRLRMVTTNLSLRRPHLLPRMQLPRASFLPSEWGAFFPDPVMRFLTRDRPGSDARHVRFPHERDLPVVVATRMSLSFPLLFKAVPIHAADLGSADAANLLADRKSTPPLVRMWLSDGGLSSNFPVQLFDAPLPRWPTFAISLDDLPSTAGDAKRRAALPRKASQGFHVPSAPIATLADFLWQVFASAKDWQDTLQSTLLGQRERVVRIYLGKGEGGLSLDMDSPRTRRLMGYGLEAGQLLTSGAFDFDEHRWRRTLAFYQTSYGWVQRAQLAWTEGFSEWFRGYDAKSFDLSENAKNEVADSIGSLVASMGADLRSDERLRRYSRTSGRLRVVPDLEPEMRPLDPVSLQPPPAPE